MQRFSAPHPSFSILYLLSSILFLLSFITLTARAADEEIRLSAPPTAAEAKINPSLFPKSKYPIPDFAQPGEGSIDIKRPDEISPEDQEVLRSAAALAPYELSDLLQVYERMGNLAMIQSLSRILIERVPDHPVARQMLAGLEGKDEVRKPDYLDQKAAEVLAGKVASDPEAVASQARALIAAKHSDQAIELLDALHRTTFPSQPFPFIEDLGYAHMDLQHWPLAAVAFEEVLAQKTLPASQRERVTQHLDLVHVEQRIADLRSKNYAAPAAALAASATLLNELPDHPSAIAFRIECLQYAGKNSEALAMLEQLQTAAANAPAFAYQRLLGYTYLQLKQWPAAQTAFEQMRDNPIFTEEARQDASKAITTSAISARGEAALVIAGFGDWEKAEAQLAGLERDFPNSIEVFSYRCALIARQGHGDEALRLLEAKKAQLASESATKNKPFQLQDTIGDVQVARKDFDKARAAYQAILDEPKYDWAMRRRALDAMPAVRRIELLEQGFNALRDRRISKAKDAARKLYDEFGMEARELKLLTAEIHLAQNKTSDAITELEVLKKTAPSNAPFESSSSLATGYMRSGRHAEAIAAYTDILAHHRAYTPYEAMSARWELRAALPLAKPSADISVNRRSEADGSITRADATYTGPWWGDWRAQAFGHSDFIHRKAQPLATDPAWLQERYEAGLRLQRRISQTFAVEATVGGSQDDILYGAKVGNFLNPGFTWSAAFTGNGRSTESIPLEALDARENRIDLDLAGQLPGPWNYALRASANDVRVGKTAVGHGIGAVATLEYVIQTETDKRPEITVGLLSEYRRFTSADAGSMLASLVDQETNRHGLTLAYRSNVSDSLRLSAQVGGFYSFDESSLQYMAGLGVQYYFSDSFLAYLDLRYDSNSRSAQQDVGAFEANIGLAHTF